jgi:hypothetical protein
MINSSVNDCKVIQLPKIHNPAGNITSINNRNEIPFSIERVYYLFDVPGGESRGGHAHKALQQLIIAAGGSFDIVLNDGLQQRRVQLNRPYIGLYMPSGIWRELENFSSGSTCLVLASHKYDEDDYLRDYSRFSEWKLSK